MAKSICDIEYKKLEEMSKNLWIKSNKKAEEKDKVEEMKGREEHCKKVSQIALLLFENIYKKSLIDINDKEKDYEKKVLYISSLLHDVKKYKKKHHIAASEYVKKKLTEIDKDEMEDIGIIIKGHNSEDDIKFIYDSKKISSNNLIKLILIIRYADKLSKLDNYNDEESINEKIKKVNNESKHIIQKIGCEEEMLKIVRDTCFKLII